MELYTGVNVNAVSGKQCMIMATKVMAVLMVMMMVMVMMTVMVMMIMMAMFFLFRPLSYDIWQTCVNTRKHLWQQRRRVHYSCFQYEDHLSTFSSSWQTL